MTTDARALDWDEVTARLAAAAESPAGRAICLALPFAADVAEARRRMAAVAELATAPARGRDAAVAGGAGDRRGAGVGREDGGARVPKSCVRSPRSRATAEACGAICWRPRRCAIPEIAALARDLDPPLGLARAIDDTFDAAGEIRDTASPELERLRAERQGLQDRARVAIEELMRVEEYASVMQDQFFTIRAERYVLPLKASAKSLGPRHRARHVAHGRDRVRRADRAGRGQQPAQGHRAGDPAGVAAHPRTADRGRRDRGRTAAADGGDAGGDRRARGGGAAGGRLRRQPRRDRRDAGRRAARRAASAARAVAPGRRAWSPTTSRWAAGSRRS